MPKYRRDYDFKLEELVNYQLIEFEEEERYLTEKKTHLLDAFF
jgi:hypothetical protein